MIHLKINSPKMHLYDCFFDPKMNVLHACNGQNERIGIVAKNALGFFEWLWNGIRSLFDKNAWAKVYIEDSLGKNQKIYLKIDSLREEFLYSSNESHTLKKLRQHLAFALKDKLDEKTRLRISLESLSYMQVNAENKFANIEEEMESHFIQLHDTIRKINNRKWGTEDISLDELKGLFQHIEAHRPLWMDIMKKDKIACLYLRHTQNRIRTLRVESNGDVFIILRIVVGIGVFKKVRLAINVNKKKLAVHVVGLEIKEEIEDGKRFKKNIRENLIVDFTTPVAHRNVAKQGSILDFTHCKNGRLIKKMGVIMPYYNKKDMTNFTSKNLTGERKKQIVLSSLRGLKAIHDGGFLHRDIKLNNIFIKRSVNKITKEKEYVAKIGDFGFVTRPANVDRFVGTPMYVAPELWLNSDAISYASDCYSLGLSLGIFLGLKLSEHDLDMFGDIPPLLENIPLAGIYVNSRNKKNIGTPDYLVSQLLKRNPKKRISLEKAIVLAEITNF